MNAELIEKLKLNKDFEITEKTDERLKYYSLKVRYKGKEIFNDGRFWTCGSCSKMRVPVLMSKFMEVVLNELKIDY